MVHYKLTYFDFRGLGEVTRQLFHLADVDYEEKRLSLEEFKKVKHTFPSGLIPILEIDGVVLSQSSAINRYLAKMFGLVGKTPLEEAQVDEILGIFMDCRPTFRPFFFGHFLGKPQEELNRLKEEDVIPACAVIFKELNRKLKTSKSGFLVGDSLTWADLQAADLLTTLKGFGVFNPSEEPLLAAHHQKICSIPKLKEYLDKRPETII